MNDESGRAGARPLVRAATFVGEWLYRHRWFVLLVLAAFLLRLHWNLVAHPIGEFMYSDMRGYFKRADKALDQPWATHEYDAFFPFGTAWLIAAIKVLFGRENFVAIGTVYALLGAGIVGFTYGITLRVTQRRWLPPVVGLFALIYYPLISLGGYMLSEVPFSFFLSGSIYTLLRLHESGHKRWAFMTGLLVGLGATIRPQMLMSVALFGVFWLFARKRMPNVTIKRLLVVALPLGLILIGSAYRFHRHTGRWGIVSENGPINQVFGRCHNKGLYSRPDGKGHGTVRFAPPPVIQLERRSSEEPNLWIHLRPVFGDYPEPVPGVDGFNVDGYGCRHRDCHIPGGEIQYKGYIGDRDIQKTIIKECIRRSGMKRQLMYSLTHVVQLWAYNAMWPDQANPKPRPKNRDKHGWAKLEQDWRKFHNIFLAIPALIGLGAVFRTKKNLPLAIVSLNLWSLVIVASLYIGGIRFRVPYDPVIIVLAFCVWVQGGSLLGGAIAKLAGRGSTTRTDSAPPPGADA